MGTIVYQANVAEGQNKKPNVCKTLSKGLALEYAEIVFSVILSTIVSSMALTPTHVPL